MAIALVWPLSYVIEPCCWRRCTLWGTGHRRIKLELSCTAIPRDMKKRVACKITLGRTTPADTGLPHRPQPSISHRLLPYMAKQSQGFWFSAVASHGSRASSILCGGTYLTASPPHLLPTADSHQLLDLLCPGVFIWMVPMAMTPTPESPLASDEQPKNSLFLHPRIHPVFRVEDPDGCICTEQVSTFFFLVLFPNKTIE